MPNIRRQTFTLKIYYVFIERVYTFNCLGLTEIIGILNRLNMHYYYIYITLFVYNSLISISHINYCIMIWGYQSNKIT